MDNQNTPQIPDFFETSRDCIFLLDNKGFVLDLNPRGIEKLGYSKAEIIGKNVANVVPKDFLQTYSENINKVFTDKKVTFESTLEHKTGEKIPVEIHGYSISYQNTNAIFVMHQDIRLRKEIENMLKSSRSKYDAVFCACPDGVLIVGKDGKILDVNEAYLNRSDYTREDLSKLNFFEMISDEHRIENAANLQKVIQKGKGTFEGSHKMKNGQIWSTKISATYDEPNNRFIIAFMDNKKGLDQLIEDLNNSKKDIQKFIDSVDMAVILGKPDGTINFVNKRFAKILDYSVEELLKLTTRQIAHPDDYRPDRQQAVYEEKIKEVATKFRLFKKTGETVWIVGTGSLYMDQSGEKYLIGQWDTLSKEELAKQSV
ncbi:MAG: PAS domain-containing protein [Spirochaetia bacterium]|nr:PAS domain-containing protein [Spirochaetia bacterium]